MAPPPPVPVRIAATASLLPGRAVSTAEIARQVVPPRDPADVEARTGIVSRHFADPDQSKGVVGAEVLRAVLDAAGMRPDEIARLFFVNSHGGDLLFPATANLVAARIGIVGTCDCIDLNNGCMGFLSAFDLGARSVATGGGPVAVVVSEQGSRYITPDDPRPFLVCGDAAAAVILTAGRADEGMLASWLRNDGTVEGVHLAHPGLTGRRETIRFEAPNARISRFAIDAIQQSAATVLAQAGLSLGDVEWVVPHQPNGSLLAMIVRTLGVDPGRTVPVVQEIGSVGAAAIPVSLDRLLRTRPVRAGDRILMVGVGAGTAYGAILHRVGG